MIGSRQWWLGIIISLIIWALMISEYWLGYYFMGQTLSFQHTVVLLVALHYAVFMPAPGGFGVVESSQLLVLSLLGLDPAVGISVIVFTRFREFLFCGLGGWWIFFTSTKYHLFENMSRHKHQ